MATRVVLNNNTNSSSSNDSSKATGSANMTSESKRAFEIDPTTNTMKASNKNQSAYANLSHKRSRSYGGMNVYPTEEMAYHTSKEISDEIIENIYAIDIIEDEEHKFISLELLSKLRRIIDTYMSKNQYDADNDGIVDYSNIANTAKKIDWKNITNKPNIDTNVINNINEKSHEHSNIGALNLISKDNENNPLWNGLKWPNTNISEESNINEKHTRNIFISETTPNNPNIGDLWIKIDNTEENNLIKSINIAKDNLGNDWYSFNIDDIITTVNEKVIENITNNLIIVDHDQLNDLQGGKENEHYHLTREEYLLFQELLEKYKNNEIGKGTGGIPIDDNYDYSGGGAEDNPLIIISGGARDESEEFYDGAGAETIDSEYENEEFYDGGYAAKEFIIIDTFPDNDASAYQEEFIDEKDGANAKTDIKYYESEDFYDGGNANETYIDPEEINGNSMDESEEAHDGGGAETINTNYEDEDFYDGGDAGDVKDINEEEIGTASDNNIDTFNGGGAFNEENDELQDGGNAETNVDEISSNNNQENQQTSNPQQNENNQSENTQNNEGYDGGGANTKENEFNENIISDELQNGGFA